MKGKRMKQIKGLYKKLCDSPINYFSDLFVCSVVVAWIILIAVETIVGIVAPGRAELTIWANVNEMVKEPLTGGIVTWMLKNGVCHAVAGAKGKTAEKDFPAVPVEDLDDSELCGEG